MDCSTNAIFPLPKDEKMKGTMLSRLSVELAALFLFSGWQNCESTVIFNQKRLLEQKPAIIQ